MEDVRDLVDASDIFIAFGKEGLVLDVKIGVKVSILGLAHLTHILTSISSILVVSHDYFSHKDAIPW